VVFECHDWIATFFDHSLEKKAARAVLGAWCWVLGAVRCGCP